jgi:RNA polymerase sigma-70 factor (ECF subfamily)
MEERNNSIINMCKKGDRKAQTHLYSVFYKKVYNSCFRILQNQYEAEDAMQESFIKAFSQLDKYDEVKPFEAWILRIAINTAIDKLRENKPEWVNYDEKFFYHLEDENELEIWELTLEKTKQIKAAIERLPDTARLIINLYLIEGYDHEEISGILNTTSGNVRIQYMRAKQKLIEMLK